ncbi:MAG: hypothetical protein HYZ83_00405 [Candidatus Omnitrophica bacterium]|nr:hypothetical protein [Candidatus Omnitrophota bacterium]
MQPPSRSSIRIYFLPLILSLFISLIWPVDGSAQIVKGLSDEELLNTIQEHAFKFFVEEANPKNGLVRDRAHNFQKGATRSAASIASVGFALTAYPVAVKRGWMDESTAYEITKRTLAFFLTKAAQEHGFFYHYLDMETGARINRSELSPIDTALFLAGALFSAEYFNDSTIRDLVLKIYDRVDWNWMLHGGQTLSLAWSPEQGFFKQRWDHYNESLIMYLLAIGSPTKSIPAESWKAIYRPVGSYRDFRLIQMPPLFTHQYSHIWIDFRDKNDGMADYFKNSMNATLAQRSFAIDHQSEFKSYGPNSWGLTASDGPFGYKAYGAPPGWALHDGTIAPTACGSSIVFTPQDSINCLRHFYENIGSSLWGQYGFSDAFNLDKNWFDQDVIGIDQGTLLLMIENYRSGMIWEIMSKSVSIAKAMEQVGFKPGTLEVAWPDPPQAKAAYVRGGIQVDGYLKDWPEGQPIGLTYEHKETGEIKNDGEDLTAMVRFAWDERALYFSAVVTDNSIILRKTGKNIWQDDLLEIFVDPGGDGLNWGNSRDFQIGFRPHTENSQVEIWSWFQNTNQPPDPKAVQASGYVHKTGYLLEGAIGWDYLGIEPVQEMLIRVTPAIHDIDQDRSQGKVQWFFRNEYELNRFVLGQLILGGPHETQGK